MKRNILTLLLLIACVLIKPVHAMAQMTPIEFNDHIAYITDSLYSKGSQWGTLFNMARATKDFASLAPSREALEKYVDARIVEITGMKDVKNSKDLRMAMLSFLKYEKNMITKGFRPVEKLPSSATDEQVDAALQALTDLSKDEAAELQKVGKAQEAYAKANGFSIEASDAGKE